MQLPVFERLVRNALLLFHHAQKARLGALRGTECGQQCGQQGKGEGSGAGTARAHGKSVWIWQMCGSGKT
eukprot:365057-Chlamydomonas_euryale.AAC.14